MTQIEKDEPKLSEEVAEIEFLKFMEAMDLTSDEREMDEDREKSFEHHKKTMVTKLMQGSLIIDERGRPVYTPQRSENKEPLVFNEPSGASIMGMNKGSRSNDISATYSAMADMTKTSAKRFSNMKISDLKVCSAITTLFLAQA